MELQFSFFLVPLVVYFLFLVAWNTFKASRTSKPPGPPKLPIIGNAHQLSGSYPPRVFHNLAKKYGPLMHLQLGENSTIVVSSPSVAKEFLKNDVNFAQRVMTLTGKLLFYDGNSLIFSPFTDYWRRMRKLCMVELLSPKRVRSFRPIREEEVSNLITRLSSCEGCPVNLSEMILSLTCGIVSRAAFGEKCKGQEEFLSILNEAQRPATGFSLAEMYPSIPLLSSIIGLKQTLKRLSKRVDRILGNIINEHRNKKNVKTGIAQHHEDVIEILLNLQNSSDLDFKLSDDCIKAIIMDIFVGGTETSSTCVEWAMTELIKNPEMMKRAQDEVRQAFKEKGTVDETGLQELKYLKAIINEILRFHPVVPLVKRECRTSCEILGYPIPAKTHVLLNIFAICRDPESWNEAEKFIPERFLDNSMSYMGTDFEYLPFGSGRRLCPGIAFAMPDVELPLAQLLYHFDWKLANGMTHDDLDVEEELGLSGRRKHSLLAVPTPYRPLSH